MSVGFSDPDAIVPPRDGGPECEYCKNRRFVLDAQGNLKPCPKCNMVQEWRVSALQAYASRSALSAQQTFDTFQTTFNGKPEPLLLIPLRAAQRFAENPEGSWLVIYGARGCGKSHLCAAVDNALMARGVPSLFISAPDLIASLFEAMNTRTEEGGSLLERRKQVFKTAPVLILDDLGAEASSPLSEGWIFEILDYRWRNRLPTMIATNVHPSQFEERLASRLQDTSLCQVVENRAPDYRLRPIEEKQP